VTRWYNHIRKMRLGLYMIPVGFGLLAFPATAVFAPILALYMTMFEPEKPVRRVIWSAWICGVWWLTQAALTWHYAVNVRPPLLDFWLTQPLVVLRAFWFFVAPFQMGGVSTLQPVEHLWSPWALAGYAGTAGLIVLALRLSRLPEWRVVAFGIWWFLIAMAPSTLQPQIQVESFPRVFFASIGLLLALSRGLWILGARFLDMKVGEFNLEIPALGAGLVLALAVLALFGQKTIRLNEAWQSDDSLWKDLADRNPNDGVALMRSGALLLDSKEADFFDIRLDLAYNGLKRAVALLPHNPEALTSLAVASGRKRLEADSLRQLQEAMRFGPRWAPAFSAYGRWLLDRGRLKEAMQMGEKAVQLDPTDLEGLQVIADTYIAQPDWKQAIAAAQEIIRIDPDDEDAQRSLHVAQAGLTARATAEEALAKAPDKLDNYLALSALYYQEKRYEDCIKVAQQALKKQPDVVEAWVNIATAYHALGKTDEGIAALREAAKLRPDLALVQNNLHWELAHKAETPGN
jgi:tetratricopeptide (TPR) repeat protein